MGLDGRPFWYGGLLNIFNTSEGLKLRPNHDWWNLAEATSRFQEFYVRMTSRREGGIVSLFFHPAEFIHNEFWDAVNFARGANPPREEWKVPPMKTPDESARAFKYFEDLVTYMKSFPRLQFVTASQAFELFRDAAQRRAYSADDLLDIAKQVGPDVSFQVHDEYELAASEVFLLLNRYVENMARKAARPPLLLDGTPYGPGSPGTQLNSTIEVPWTQFSRTVLDVADFLAKRDQLPNAVWLGSHPVPPESYLLALSQVTMRLIIKGGPPDFVSVAPARLTAAQHVAEDSPGLWDWVILPPGFRAPNLMALAKLQAWTLKPARLHPPTLTRISR